MPRVAAVVLAVSQPLHLSAVVMGNPTLDLVSWSLTAVGMGFLGYRLVHTSDDEWDVPPRSNHH
jgi:hypothetical protein